MIPKAAAAVKMTLQNDDTDSHPQHQLARLGAECDTDGRSQRRSRDERGKEAEPDDAVLFPEKTR
jgi:hypothetical protein